MAGGYLESRRGSGFYARLKLQQHLVGFGRRRRDLFDAERLAEVGKNGGFHGWRGAWLDRRGVSAQNLVARV